MIMATSQNGYSADCLVVCQAKITGITINPVTVNMTVGQKITLTATTSPEIVTEKVTWKSRNEDVVKVDNNGNVTLIGNGEAQITVSTENGLIATCDVAVETLIQEITLDRNIIIFDLNKTTTSQITATVTPADATEKIQWTSSDTDVAIIIDTGLVTAKSAGTATITVKNANGTKSAICEVNVIEGQGYLLGSGNTDSSK